MQPLITVCVCLPLRPLLPTVALQLAVHLTLALAITVTTAADIIIRPDIRLNLGCLRHMLLIEGRHTLFVDAVRNMAAEKHDRRSCDVNVIMCLQLDQLVHTAGLLY